ncbi:MAG: M15 family metallopeptidase [Peptostreptococcaceae bacterium]
MVSSVRSKKRKRALKKKRQKLTKYILIAAIVICVLVGGTSLLEATLVQENNVQVNIEDEYIEPVEVINYENLILVNRDNEVDENFVPRDLVELNVKFLNDNKSNNLLKEEVANQVEIMFEDAKKDGINLLAVSGYRSYEYQKKLYQNKVKKVGKYEADKYVAEAGTSEHQTGLAIDILSTEYKKLDQGFENTKAYKWLIENIEKYGFILRYQEGKESITGYRFEPWHFRYVGKDLAEELKEKNITLEEYYGVN